MREFVFAKRSHNPALAGFPFQRYQSLALMEYSPPPLFKQGASARAKMLFFALIAIALLMADSRLRTLGVVRQTIGAALYPVQVVAMLPRDAFFAVTDYFGSLTQLQNETARMREQQVLNSQRLQQNAQLLAENTQLRKLLDASDRVQTKTLMSEILYDARDPFSRKIILDRGQSNGIRPGQPVIDDLGVIGQVTRVFPFTSEVTLITDKDQAIPVQVLRSGVRSVAYGRGQSGVLELRFMASNADIRKGDVLSTSGIDGVYPSGLSVATVVSVDTQTSDAFARILCQPSAGVSRHRQVLILLAENNQPPPPAAENSLQSEQRNKRPRKDTTETTQ
jgi:rod shape-determining protein MreC